LSGVFGEVDIPAGASSVQVVLHAFNLTSQRRAKNATLKLLPSTTYRLSIPKKASVAISGGQ
jgi:hypothetical protein